MKRSLPILIILLLSACGPQPQQVRSRSVRVAVIGGMVQTGLWEKLSERFENQSGLVVELVTAGPKEALIPYFERGEIDLLTMHSSDEATLLVAEGLAVDIRPWAKNEHVIMGPASDPAQVRGLKSGAEALTKIAETKSLFIDAQGGGKRLVSERLWHKTGIRPIGDWVLKDESGTPTELLHFAETKNAYAICGRIPVLTGKIPKGSMEIMVEGDPDMQRPFVVVRANPAKFSGTNSAGAKLLSDFLVSEKTQSYLREIAREQPAGVPLFYPLF